MTNNDSSATGKKYPHPRVKGMGEIFDFIKEPDWRPTVFDVALLRRLKVSPSHEVKTLAALRFLGLTDETNAPTKDFDALKNDYQATLKRIVKDRYAQLFKELPTRLATSERLVAFFGDPPETAEYRAMFFVWLCRQAGIDLPKMLAGFHRSRFDRLGPSSKSD